MVLSCRICGLKVGRSDDHLQCNDCSRCFHLHCGKVEVNEFMNMRQDKSLKLWKCEGCKNAISDTREVNKASTVVHIADHSINAQEDMASSTPGNVVLVNKTDIEKILQGQLQIIATLKDTQKDLNSVKQENWKLKEAIVDNRELINDLRKQISVLENTIGQWRQQSLANCNNSKNMTQKSTAVLGVKNRELSIDPNKILIGKRLPQKVSGNNEIKQKQISSSIDVVPIDGSRGNNLQCSIRDSGIGRDPVQESGVTVAGLTGGDLPSAAAECDDNWTEVERKKRRHRGNKSNFVVGSIAETCGIQVAPRKAFLFVSRLKADTSCSDVVAYLKPRFPEVVCEQLPSRFPEHCASFKVIIDFSNLELAMHPEVWPMGAYVGRFFQRRAHQVSVVK